MAKPDIETLKGEQWSQFGEDQFRAVLQDEPLEKSVFMPTEVEIFAQEFVGKLERLGRSASNIEKPKDEIWSKIDGNWAKTRTKEPIKLTDNVVIAVHGAWGAGKTSLLRALQQELKEKQAITLLFEPWRYEKEDNLIIPLLVELSAEIQSALTVDNAKRAAIETSKKLIGRVGREVLRAGSKLIQSKTGIDLYAIGEEYIQSYSETSQGWERFISEVKGFQEDLERLVMLASNSRMRDKSIGFENEPPPIVIFIDDLDRCQHEQVRRLLESIKLFLNTPGVVFVLALDEQQVLRALGQPYMTLLKGEEDAEIRAKRLANRYLEKFFQIKIDLSDRSAPFDQIVDDFQEGIWHQMVNELCRNRSGSGLHDLSAFEFNVLAALKNVFLAVKGNPRAIKGFARQLFFAYPSLQTYTVPEDKHPRFKDIIRDFAELAFQVNFGSVWVNEIEKLSPDARATCFAACRELLHASANDDSNKIDEEDESSDYRTFDEEAAVRLHRRLNEIKYEAASLEKEDLPRGDVWIGERNGIEDVTNGPEDHETDAAAKLAEQVMSGSPEPSTLALTQYPLLRTEMTKMARRQELEALTNLLVIFNYLALPYEKLEAGNLLNAKAPIWEALSR